MMRQSQIMEEQILDACDLRLRVAEDLVRLSQLLGRGLWAVGKQAIRDAKGVQEGLEELGTGLKPRSRGAVVRSSPLRSTTLNKGAERRY